MIVTIFTELFGLQTYLVNGVRTASSKGTAKAAVFQPGAILDLIAYHNEMKNLQRLKEFKWSYLFQTVLSDVVKNSVSLFMIELVTKCLKQPESNPDLFHFVEDALEHLDRCSEKIAANFPLFFAIHLAVFFGFRITDDYSEKRNYLDLTEGNFIEERPSHPHYLQDREAEAVSHLLKIMQPEELADLSLNRETRRRMMQAMETYYAFHVSEFGTMRTLPVLREIMR